MDIQGRLVIKEKQLKSEMAQAVRKNLNLSRQVQTQRRALEGERTRFLKVKEQLRKLSTTSTKPFQLGNAQNLRRKIQQVGRDVKLATAQTESLRLAHQSQIGAIKLLREKGQLVTGKLDLLASQKLQCKQVSEQELLCEVRAAGSRETVAQSMIENLAPLGDSLAAPIMSGVPTFPESLAQNALSFSRGSPGSESPSSHGQSAGSNLETPRQPEVQTDSNGGAALKLTVQDSQGKELKLSVDADRDQNLTILMDAGCQMLARRLWREKAHLLNRLVEAGLRIEKLSIANVGGVR